MDVLQDCHLMFCPGLAGCNFQVVFSSICDGFSSGLPFDALSTDGWPWAGALFP